MSHVDASREAAGPCDNTVLLMYKWRERLILNLVNTKMYKGENKINIKN